MKTLADAWASFEARVLPATAGPVQRQETRRGFYAGAHALLGLIEGTAIDDISEDQGAAMIERLSREIGAFFEDVTARRA